jgi:hypothetical protein
MKIKFLSVFFLAFFCLSFSAYSQEPEENEEESTTKDCKDYPMLGRMDKFDFYDCSKNFNEMEIRLSDEETKNVEGMLNHYTYIFNDENVQAPSWYQIYKNYDNAIKKLGGTILFNDKSGDAYYQVKKGNMEIYLHLLGSGGNQDSYSEYQLQVLEVELMKQEVTATDIFKNLEKDGFMTVDIQFETGKSTIKA